MCNMRHEPRISCSEISCFHVQNVHITTYINDIVVAVVDVITSSQLPT